MDPTSFLTGMFPAIILISAALTAAASFFLLWLFRRAVLMDLRSFSPTNRGCLYELEQRLEGIPLERVLLLFDDSTDRAFLEGALRDLWGQVPADPPNRAMRSPEVRLFRVSEGSPGEVRALLGFLFGE